MTILNIQNKDHLQQTLQKLGQKMYLNLINTTVIIVKDHIRHIYNYYYLRLTWN